MGHMIQSFIGGPGLIKDIVSPLGPVDAATADLPQDLQCLFLSQNLLNAIQEYKHTSDDTLIEPFEFLDQVTKSYLEELKPYGRLIYIETDYFGGVGSQASGLFKDGRLMETYQESSDDIDVTLPWPDRLLNSPVNKALQYLGVIRDCKYDEFDTLGLSEYRHMPKDEL